MPPGAARQKDSVLRHSLLAIGLLLIVTSPISTCCLQLSGFAIVTIPKHALAELDNPSDSTDGTASRESQVAVQLQSPESSNVEVQPVANEPMLDQVIQPDLATAPLTLPPAAPISVATTPVITLPATSAGQLTTADFMRIALGCWFVVSVTGSCGLFMRWLMGWFWLRRLIQHSQSIENPAIHQAFRQACQALNHTDSVTQYRVSTNLASPIVVGVLKPVILLPDGLTSEISGQQLNEVMLHELAHVVRRDPLTLQLQIIARMLFWMHPLVHAICRGLTRASEEICDNFVLQQNSIVSYSRTC